MIIFRIISQMVAVMSLRFLYSHANGVCTTNMPIRLLPDGEKNDTLSFDIPPHPGTQDIIKESLGFSITGAYPFMGFTTHRGPDHLSSQQAWKTA